MYLQIQLYRATPQQDALPEVLRSIRLSCHMFQGITEATMQHDEAWNFLRLGRMMERADKTSRILDVKYFILLPSPLNVGTPYDDLHWAAVLKSVSGFETYRKMRGRITPLDIVEFLVTDREFPRAMLYEVTHTTLYHYEAPVSQCLNEVRLTPRATSTQRVNVSSLQVEPAPAFVYQRMRRYFQSHLKEEMALLRTIHSRTAQ